MKGFDYIIVGSGSAGALLATRLSENPDVRVLVIEAGSKDTGFWLKLPVGYFRSIYDPRHSHLYRSETDPGIAGRQMDCPRGRVLGGSGAINGLIFIRGQRQDFDDWQGLGAQGWGYDDVLPHFRKLEAYDGPPSQYRGAHGPICVRDLRNDNPACEAWLRAAAEYGLDHNPDFNAEHAAGIGRYQLTLDGHWRSSAGRSMLRPALSRPNLTLELRAHVTGLLRRADQVTGVRYLQTGSNTKCTPIAKSSYVRARCNRLKFCNLPGLVRRTCCARTVSTLCTMRQTSARIFRIICNCAQSSGYQIRKSR